MNPHSTTALIFQMFQFQLKSNYVPHGSYNKLPQISQTHKLHFLQIYCHSSNSIPISSIENAFAASYLTNRFGFTSESALRASKYVRFRSPEKSESVINLLTAYGFSQADISKLVKRDPRILGYNLERIISKIEFLISKGASSRDVVDILVLNPSILDSSLENVIIPFYNLVKDAVHSDGKAIAALKRSRRNHFCRISDIPVSMNFLRHIGVPESNIAYVLLIYPQTLGNSGWLKQAVEELKEMGGLDPSKKNFVKALIVKRGLSESKWRKKIDVYKSWGLTEEDIFGMFKIYPQCMACSEKKMSAVMDLIVNKLGWGPSVIAKYSVLFGMSLETRIIPRDSVIQSLLSKGLMDKKSYVPKVFKLTEEGFLDKYVRCYEFADELLKLYWKEGDESQLEGGSESVQRL